MDRTQFKTTIDSFMESEIDRLLKAVPSAAHLIDEREPLNERYYLRHRIETVKRIWMTAKTDSLALAAMIDEDYDAARKWSKYTYQELSHDLLFLKDLDQHGYTLNKVASIPAFSSTLAMVNYIESSIARIGSIAAVAYSVWVEWNSDRASATVVNRVRKAYSPKHIKGANAHVGIDLKEDHYEIMIDISLMLLRRKGTVRPLFEMLGTLTDFVIAYFEDLESFSMPQGQTARLSFTA